MPVLRDSRETITQENVMGVLSLLVCHAVQQRH
jgi:hypothetical protein